VHDEMFERLGLRVDEVKGVSGTSNDGNTARRAFEAYEVFAEIVGVDAEMVHNFGKILSAINCQLPLNPDAFQDLCLETAYQYIFLYGWYHMPSTVHKILIHGRDLVQNR